MWVSFSPGTKSFGPLPVDVVSFLEGLHWIFVRSFLFVSMSGTVWQITANLHLLALLISCVKNGTYRHSYSIGRASYYCFYDIRLHEISNAAISSVLITLTCRRSNNTTLFRRRNWGVAEDAEPSLRLRTHDSQHKGVLTDKWVTFSLVVPKIFINLVKIKRSPFVRCCCCCCCCRRASGCKPVCQSFCTRMTDAAWFSDRAYLICSDFYVYLLLLICTYYVYVSSYVLYTTSCQNFDRPISCPPLYL